MARKKHEPRPTNLRDLHQYTAWRTGQYYAEKRGEDYALTLPEFKAVWGDKWEQRGVIKGKYCLLHIDHDKPWTVDNVKLGLIGSAEVAYSRVRGKRSRKHSDPKRHSQYRAWQRMKAQAKFRKEPFELSFEDYYTIWDDKWDQRGRGSDNYCITRITVKKSWNKDNVVIMKRLDQLQSTYRGKGSAHKINRS